MVKKINQKVFIMEGINLKKEKSIILPKSKKAIVKKGINVDEKSIQLPSDFDSLLDIRDFGKTYKQVISFINNIKEFQNEYLENMIKSKDEVLQFIPENHLDKYNVYLQDKLLCKWNDLDIKNVQNNIVDQLRQERIYYRRHYAIELVGLISQNDKIFLIDTVNKKIQLCLWYRHSHRETIQGWMYGYFCNLEYLRDCYSFDILPEEDLFRISVKLRRNGLTSASDIDAYRKQVPYFESDRLYGIGSNGGNEVYDFCMKTNTFKGYNEKESQYSWSSSYRTFKY